MRYRAFISYASADRPIAERVHRALERYRIPRPLRGLDRGHGLIPKRLTPMFRDRSDADASGSLATVLASALERSDALVVLCSPASARSPWVNQEIRHFKSLGRGARIFPLLIDGLPRRYVPDTVADGAFPPALFQRVDAPGVVVAEDDPEPLAADIRVTGDGFDLATLKIVGGLTGVTLTELTQRQFEAERLERRIVRAVAATMTVLAVAAVAAAISAYYSADAARARLSSAIEMAARRVDDGARFGDQYGVPSEVIRQLLVGAERDFSTLTTEDEAPAPMLQLQRGRLQALFSRLYGATGDATRQIAHARDAVAMLASVPTTRQWRRPDTWLATLPSATALVGEQLGAIEALGLAVADSGDGADEALRLFERGRDDAMGANRPDFVARFWARIGELRYAQGDLPAATAAQDAALTALDGQLRDRGSIDPFEQASALSDRAELLLERERAADALADQTRVVEILEERSTAMPDDASASQSLAHALTRQADMRYAVSGSWDGAMSGLERAVALLDRASASDRARVDYARDLSVGLERLGDVMLQTGNLTRASAAFERMVRLRRDRLALAPDQVDAQRDLAVGLERIGDLERARARPDRALAALDEARALRASKDATAHSDPVLARDRAVLWYKTGAARAAAGRGQWREAFESAIGLMEPLLVASNAPAGWMRDVAVFRFAYAEALSTRGSRADARRQWSAALALVERQLLTSPDDPRLLQDRTQLLERLQRSSTRLR